MRRWRIYYDDGTTRSDYEGLVENVPSLGVIAITFDNQSVGKLLISGRDYFILDGIWRNCDVFGLWDYLQRPGLKKVLFGRIMETSKYEGIMKAAYNDPYPSLKDTDHHTEKSWSYSPDRSQEVTPLDRED